MNANLRQLHALGQSLWVDNITRQMVGDGTLKSYIDELSVTGLTSNPTIFEHAIAAGNLYDEQMAELSRQGRSGEDLFFELAMRDLRGAADLLRPCFDATDQVDGWVSLEVSPAIANDTAKTTRMAVELHARAARENLYIKIPGTPAGLKAVEASIYAGVPVNVTLLFSREHYLGAARAYLRGLERRVAAGLDPRVGSVASLFVSRWDVAVHDEVPVECRNRLGIAVAKRTYKAYRDLLDSPRWRKLLDAGAQPQRLLWASTGTKDASAPDTLYVQALAARDTIDTIPDPTLQAFADHGQVHAPLAVGGGDAESVIAEFHQLGIDDAALALRLQLEGTASFRASWDSLLAGIRNKVSHLDGVAA